MDVSLLVQNGRHRGLALIVPREGALEIGRRARDASFLDDPTMSRLHFTVQRSPRGILLRSLAAENGTRVNGLRVQETLLQDGDTVSAGSVLFLARIAGAETAESPLERLRRARPLFAVLDGASSPRIVELLQESDARFESLYEGKSAVELAEYAPYLVAFGEDELLEQLVTEGWDSHWGVYLSSDARFEDLRKHLRRFLLVELEGRVVYFRFYDPRVLRSYLPTCTVQEKADFLGPIAAYFAEGEIPATVECFQGAPSPPTGRRTAAAG